MLEVVESHDGNAYRAVYTVRFEKALYVLHAFQKKTQHTARGDIELAARRFRQVTRSTGG